MERSNDFICWEGTNNSAYSGQTNTSPVSANTGPTPLWSPSILGGGLNVVVSDNTYSGNPSLTSVTTNYGYYGPGGIIWLQTGGNWFFARNSITNHEVEAVQVQSGPAAMVQNNVMAYIQYWSACAESAEATQTSLTGQAPDDFFSFIGNTTQGQRQGLRALTAGRPMKINVSGNTFALHDPLDYWQDHPAGAAYVRSCLKALISGNTLTSGGWGFVSTGSTTNVVVLANDYSGAHFLGVADYNGLVSQSPDHSLESAAVVGNTLGQGVGYHHSGIYPDGAHWFMIGNQYRGWPNPSVLTNFAVEPLAMPVHFQP